MPCILLTIRAQYPSIFGGREFSVQTVTARSVHDRWPWRTIFTSVSGEPDSPEDLPAHEFQSPQLSPLVARSHRHYKLADTNTHYLVNPCRLRQQGGDLEWLAVIMGYVLRQ
jgi:hypothetical protein